MKAFIFTFGIISIAVFTLLGFSIRERVIQERALNNRLIAIESQLTELQARNQNIANAVLELQAAMVEHDAKMKSLARVVHAGRKK